MSGETSEGRPALKTRPVEKCLARKGHYKPIATEFKHGGFNYRQIAREGDVAIYEQRWRDSENVCYEVVRIRRHEAKTFPGGKSSPAREAYPSSAAWGDLGWTVTTLDAALRKTTRTKERTMNPAPFIPPRPRLVNPVSSRRRWLSGGTGVATSCVAALSAASQ